CRRRNPKGVYGIRKQQNFYASCLESFELRTNSEAVEILAEKIINCGLIGLKFRNIILEAAAATRMRRSCKARKAKYGVALFRILVKPFLQHAAKMVPNFREFFPVCF